MAKTKEGLVKDKVRLILKSYKDSVYYFMPIGGPFSRIGVPDIVGCCNGKFFSIECKAGKNKPTTLQEYEMGLARKAGGIAIVVNEDNIEDVRAMVDALLGWV